MERHRHKLGMGAATLSTIGGGIAGVAAGNTVAAIVATSSSAFATSIGTALGGAAGSVIPIVGTAIGAVVGFATGALVGYLITKYGRSHSRRRYLDNAIKSIEQQDIKFTQNEADRLKDIRPDQWKYLAKLGAPIIKELREYASLASGSQRWAKQFFYQYAVMSIAKIGYPKALIQVKGVLKVVKSANKKLAVEKKKWEAKKRKAKGKANKLVVAAREAKALEKLPSLPKVVTVEILTQLQDFGVNPFHNAKAARTTREHRVFDTERSETENRWNAVAAGVQQAFGDDAFGRFNKRFKRYADTTTDPKYAEANLSYAKELQQRLTDFIQPHIWQYDPKIRARVLELVKKYAVEVAVGDVPVNSLFEPHHNFDRKLVEELIDTADRLQAIEDRTKGVLKKRVPRDVVVRRATLPNRISSYAEACERQSHEVYGRFIGGAVDVYDECAQLLEIPPTQLAKKLDQTGKESSDPADVRAVRQAENLLHIAELAGRLKKAKTPQARRA